MRSRICPLPQPVSTTASATPVNRSRPATRPRTSRASLRTRVPLPAVRTHEVEEAVEVEGFLEKGLCLHIRGARLVEGGEDDHRHRRQFRIGLLLAAEFPPVHHGHHQIEEY